MVLGAVGQISFSSLVHGRYLGVNAVQGGYGGRAHSTGQGEIHGCWMCWNEREQSSTYKTTRNAGEADWNCGFARGCVRRLERIDHRLPNPLAGAGANGSGMSLLLGALPAIKKPNRHLKAPSLFTSGGHDGLSRPSRWHSGEFSALISLTRELLLASRCVHSRMPTSGSSDRDSASPGLVNRCVRV